ncbi:insulinase family protein [Luteibaculum oceani]|uniref:Insulinase family protein n=1 Tax=Luteibaculum oceani TaxID=1294296 RepID=A0A5C6UY99_9FLAO|nr:insulinase family protein [Luteibaculum oceani]TXC77026.1 insulinase family protein [Luteibaculum oceani]
MKKLSILFFCVTLAVSVFAQVDRSKAPAPGPAPKIQIGESETFTLENGLKVILVENHKRPVISYSLTLDYVPFMEGEIAGNASLAGSLLRAGTTSKNKEQIDKSIDFIGANFSTYATGFYASSLTKHTDKLLGIVSDVLLNPTFPKDQLEAEKKKTISGIQAGKEDPNAIMSNVSKALRYGKDHPYGEIETEETVANVSVESCKEFYNTYFRPNIAYLVIVGDITKAEAEKKVKKYFGAWQQAEVPMAVMPEVKGPEGTQVCFVPKTGAVQSVINVTYPVDLKPGAPDAIPSSVMNNILGGGVFSGRLMQNLREDKAYTYGARSSLSTDQYVGSFTAFASVRNEVTDSSVTEFLYELDRLTKEPVSKDDLSLVKNSMNGSFARALESPQTVANFALNIERYKLPKDYYANYLARLSSVSIEEVKQMAQKYIKPNNSLVIVVGNKDVAKSLEKFDADGEVTFYDFYGNEADATERKPAPEGMTAQNVFDNFVLKFTQSEDMKSALKKIKKLKDITTKGTASIQGNEIKMVTYQKAPNLFSQSIMVQGNVIQKQTFDGKKGVSISFQGRKEMEGDDLKKMEVQALLVPELEYQNLGYKSTLLGVEPVNGEDAYVVEITATVGEPSTHFYSVERGVKLQEIVTAETPNGAVTTVQSFDDFKDVKGYVFAHKMSISGPQSLVIEMDEVKVNSNVSSDLFK